MRLQVRVIMMMRASRYQGKGSVSVEFSREPAAFLRGTYIQNTLLTSTR